MGGQSKLSQVFSYQSWVHAVSGAVGGSIAMTTFYPLDTVRSRLQLEDPDENKTPRGALQVIKDIVASEGVLALYGGLGSVLQSLCISNFVYFYTFHSLKALTAGEPGTQNALKDLLLGSIAGVVNVFATAPFWVVNTRLRHMTGSPSDEMKKHYANLISGMRYVVKTEGVAALWSGTLPSLMLVSNPALHFMMYETLKRNVMRLTGGELNAAGFFFIGAAAKAFATVMTYPLQLVQAKLRHGGKKHGGDASSSSKGAQSVSMIGVMLDIIQNQGFKGLFRGLEAKILQTVLTAALMFMVYEKIATTVNRVLSKRAGP